MSKKTIAFATGPTYCITEGKKTFNDGSPLHIKQLKNGAWLVQSKCKNCGKGKSRIISWDTYKKMIKGGG